MMCAMSIPALSPTALLRTLLLGLLVLGMLMKPVLAWQCALHDALPQQTAAVDADNADESMADSADACCMNGAGCNDCCLHAVAMLPNSGTVAGAMRTILSLPPWSTRATHVIPGTDLRPPITA